MKTNKEYELAKQILTTVYKLREAIAGARHPFLEYSSEPDLADETKKELSENEKKWYAMAQAYKKRWNPVAEAITSLEANLLEAEVIWGREIVKKASPIRGLAGELRWAIQDHLEAVNPNNRSEYLTDVEERRKRRDILCARGNPERDEYKKRFDTVISAIEDALKPYILQYHRGR